METILWKICMDNLMENYTLDQIDGNNTLENYMEKGSVGPLECIFMALLTLSNEWGTRAFFTFM